MSESKFTKEFLKVFDKLCYRHSKWQVWNDFLYLASATMANVVPTAEREEREKRYLEIMDRYQEEQRIFFPELLGIITLALEENPEQDFLGTLYQTLRLEQHQKGQFFTPYSVCRFMAEIQMVEQELDKEEKPFISVNDSACGAGAMLIAFANTVKARGLNYQQKVLFVAQDIDQTAALMCYIQLSLLGCSAVIIVGDSLLKPGLHSDNQVWYTPMFYLYYWKFKSFFNDMKKTEISTTESAREKVQGKIAKCLKEADIEIKKEEVQKYMEEAGGQFSFGFKSAS